MLRRLAALAVISFSFLMGQAHDSPEFEQLAVTAYRLSAAVVVDGRLD